MIGELHRLLQIGADFNALDPEGRVKASLRYAATPEIPAIGEWVLLVDGEGNSCPAVVETVNGLEALARPDWTRWIPGQVAQLSRSFPSSVFMETDESPPTETQGEHSDVLSPV
jgi:hypothetical protein